MYNTFYLHQQRSLKIRDDERIGATACIAGLHTMATLLSHHLDKCLAQSMSPRDVIGELHNEVTASQQLLDELHRHLHRSDLLPDRTSLVSASCFVTSLTNAVKLFDELYSALTHISFADLDNGSEDSDGILTELLEKVRWQTKYWRIQYRILDR